MSLLCFEIKKLFLKPSILVFSSFFVLLLLAAGFANAQVLMGNGKAKAQYELARQYEGSFDKAIATKAYADVQEYMNNHPGESYENSFNFPADIKIKNDYWDFYISLNRYIHGDSGENPRTPFSKDGIAKRLEQLEKEKNTDSYEYASLEKKLAMMNKLGVPGYRYIMPWEALLPALTAGGNLIVNLFVLIVVMASVFSNEYSTGMDSIILSTRHGRSKIVTAKLIASLIYCTAFVLLYNMLQLAVCLAVGGTYGIGAPLQSVLSFLYGPFKITMLQFFIIQLAIQLLGCIIIVFTVAFISSRISSSLGTFFISLPVVFYPLILEGYFPGLANRIRPVLDISLIQEVRAFNIFTGYKAYNIFGVPVLYPYLLIPVTVCFGTLMVIFTYRTVKYREVH